MKVYLYGAGECIHEIVVAKNKEEAMKALRKTLRKTTPLWRYEAPDPKFLNELKTDQANVYTIDHGGL